jgi:hypothetical protein
VPFDSSRTVEEVRLPPREKSADAAHKWLQHQVAPTVSRLIEIQGAAPVLFSLLNGGCDEEVTKAIIEAAAEKE